MKTVKQMRKELSTIMKNTEPLKITDVRRLWAENFNESLKQKVKCEHPLRRTRIRKTVFCNKCGNTLTETEDKLYSREQVESLITQYAEEEWAALSSKSNIKDFNKWIKKNL